MSMRNLAMRIIDAEHKLSTILVNAKWVPSVITKSYGRLRNGLGLWLYQSRFCPSPASPTRVIACCLRSGDVYCDVGASYGQMAGIASRAVGRSGRVYAFEPQTFQMEWLRRMCKAYRLTNVKLFQSLLGDTTGEATFFENAKRRGFSSLTQAWSGGAPRTYPMVTLDAWAEQNSIDRVDLIKIDVEGAELRVLQGARRFLRRTHPLVIFEIRDRQIRKQNCGHTISDLMETLRSVGYTEFCCLRQSGLVHIDDEEDIHTDDHDMLALRRDDALHRRCLHTLSANALSLRNGIASHSPRRSSQGECLGRSRAERTSSR